MKFCPSCNAELGGRACEACGWPTSGAREGGVGFRLHRGQKSSPEDTPSGCGPCCGYLLLGVAGLGAVGAYRVGESARWTSDGPGILLVYGVLIGSILLGGVTLFTLLLQWITPKLPAWVRFFLEP